MILITGANGFLGSYIARKLISNGEKVRAIKRSTSNLELVEDIKDKMEWIDADITDVMSLEDAMVGVDFIYHTAGMISYLRKNSQSLQKINVEGTHNLVNIALEKKVKKIIYISSSSAIFKGDGNNLLHEFDSGEIEKNLSNYGRSKYLAEREIWRGVAEGLEAVVLNPTIIVGAGNWHHGSCKLFSTMYHGYKFYTNGITGFVDVRDVANIAIACMKKNISGERYIVSAENISFKDYFFMITDALQVKRPNIQANQFLSEIAWRIDALKSIMMNSEPSVTKQTARIALSKSYYDNKKIIQLLDYNFIPLNKTIQESAKLFLMYQKDQKFGHLKNEHV